MVASWIHNRRNFSMTICFNFLFFEDGQNRYCAFLICFPSYFFGGGIPLSFIFLGEVDAFFVGIVLSYFF